MAQDQQSEQVEQQPVPVVQQPVVVRSESSRQKSAGVRSVVSSDSDYDSSEGSELDFSTNPYAEECEVECIENKRVHRGITQYKVKWLGWNRRYNCWKDSDELSCDELIQEFNDSLSAQELDSVLLYDVLGILFLLHLLVFHTFLISTAQVNAHHSRSRPLPIPQPSNLPSLDPTVQTTIEFDASLKIDGWISL